MRTTISNWAFVILTSMAMVGLCGCSKDDDPAPVPNPDSGEVIDPDTPVNDPDGTIQLAMTFGSESTRIGTYLYLSSSGNLTIAESDINKNNYSKNYPSGIVSIGTCNGLGNVSTIPLTGWAQSVRAVKGSGYVYYDGYQQRYYRIFINSEITNTESVSGIYESSELLGYNFKYQQPFKGADIEITPEETSLTFAGDYTGEQAVMFTNTTMIPFTIELEGGNKSGATTWYNDWLRVSNCTDKTEPFLGNSVMIYINNANTSAEARSATITITTEYGKTSQIVVTQSGREPYISIDSKYETEHYYGYNEFYRDGGMCSLLTFSTNLPLEKLSVTSDVDWCEAVITENYEYSRSMADRNAAVRYVGGQPYKQSSPASRASDSGISYYRLALTAQPNAGEDREGTVTLMGEGAESARVCVYQYGITYTLSDCEVSVSPSSNTFYITTNIPAENLNFTGGANWCRFNNVEQANESVKITLDVDDNNSYDERSCTFKVTSDISAKTATITVVQAGKHLNISTSEFWFDRNSGYRTLTVTSSHTISATSSADWLTFSFNGDQMTIRCTAATEDRTANISFEGFDEQIIVRQSKYAVGDTYSENGVEGTVGQMDGDKRYVYKVLSSAAWSTETVLIGASDEYDGRNNWAVVTSIPNWQELYPAFALVEELNTDGVTGWYIPAAQECQLKLAGLGNTYYWSSSESTTYQVWYYRGNYTGSSIYYQTYSKSNIRTTVAVHRF